MSEPVSFCAHACPSESEVLALVCGELAPAAFTRLLAHTEACSSCALVVAEAGLALGETESFPASHSSARSSRSVFMAGSIVAGRYLIERRVGRGGMGEVYAAVDQELNDRVALKTISPAFASDPKSVDRFKQELRLARRIHHPSVCRVLEFGRHELESGASQCFFTLQFIEGVTLRRRLLELRAFALPDALILAVALAEGLQAIHAQNVVHRDVKPENVMLPAQSQGAAAVWVDFGLARVDLRETRSAGLVAGTPDYTAPELLQGDIATRLSDIYAFGVVLFELLTGTLPFPRSASFSAACQRPRTLISVPSALRGEIPPALDALVLECLDAAPARRPASAEQVAARLRDVAAALASDTIRDGSSGFAESGPVSRQTWFVALTVAAIAALISYAVYASYSASSPSAAETATTLPSSTPPSTPTPAIAIDPPSPQRRLQPKRTTFEAPASSGRPATASAPEPPVVTDFGGRR